MSFGKIYDTTWFGTPIKDGWGGIYYGLTNVGSLITKLQARATYYENNTCTTATLTALENIE